MTRPAAMARAGYRGRLGAGLTNSKSAESSPSQAQGLPSGRRARCPAAGPLSLSTVTVTPAWAPEAARTQSVGGRAAGPRGNRHSVTPASGNLAHFQVTVTPVTVIQVPMAAAAAASTDSGQVCRGRGPGIRVGAATECGRRPRPLRVPVRRRLGLVTRT